MEDSLSQSDMQELVNDFISETEEILENLDQCFIKLEESPGDNSLINEIFRAVHSIKGSAGFLGFNNLVDVAHHSENVLNKIRQNELQATPEIIDIVLESIDVIKLLLQNIKDNSRETVDIQPVKQKLELLMEYASMGGSSTLEEIKEEDNKADQQLQENQEENISQADQKDHFEQADQESSKDNSSPVVEKTEISSNKKTGEQDQGHDREQSIRVDTNRLDHVMDLVGELVLSRNRLNKILTQIEEIGEGEEKFRFLMGTVSNLNVITSDLQLAVMKMRMVPIRKIFNRFPRMVRDLARKANKKIQMKIYGESTEVDKSVIEELNDPLVHIIRNSIDHGIESPDVRIRKGKTEYGTITLGAFQEGNSIVVEIEDDGKGIDPVVIEQRAIEKGIIKGDVKLSPKEIINLIFEPGFSTAKEVTDISGRGVGMDVVKTNLSKINGVIDLSSIKGKGTRITLRIPLTLAIIQVLMVKIGKDMYALPLSSILETAKVKKDCIKCIDGQEILNVRDSLIPLLRLSNALDIGGEELQKDYVYVVLMAIAEKRIGIIVDELCHQEEVVIKSVGSYFSDIKEISGATITGDGKVSLILDPVSLIYQHKNMAIR